MKIYVYRATGDAVNEIEVEWDDGGIRLRESVTLCVGDVVSPRPPSEDDEETAQKLPRGGN